MIIDDQYRHYTDRALLVAIGKEFSSRFDTLQAGLANLSTAVQGIATSEGVIMGKVDDALALAVAQAPQMAALKTAVDNLVTFVTTTAPAQQAAAVAAALADDETKAQGIIDALNAEGASIVSETTAATGALPAATPPDQGSTGAP